MHSKYWTEEQVKSAAGEWKRGGLCGREGGRGRERESEKGRGQAY